MSGLHNNFTEIIKQGEDEGNISFFVNELKLEYIKIENIYFETISYEMTGAIK